MSTPGDAQAASAGLSEQQATEAFETLLARDEGDSEDGETQGDDEESSAQAEPEDDEAEASEDDGEEQSDEGDETDEDEEQPPTYRVKVDGEEIEVPLPELLKGYSREQDYSRKTMALGDERKALEAEKATTAELRGQYKAVLDTWADQIASLELPDSDLEALRQTDPGEYAAQKLQLKEQRDAIAAERAKVAEQERQDAEKTAAEQATQAQAKLHEEAAALFAAIPAWADPEKGAARAKADKQMMRDYAVTLGYSPEEVAAIADHRQMVVLRDAAKWRALQAKKPQVQRQVEAVKVARPGSSASRPTRATEVERAKQRLKATGSEKDAQAAFMSLIK